jgi:hypothetical protein
MIPVRDFSNEVDCLAAQQAHIRAIQQRMSAAKVPAAPVSSVDKVGVLSAPLEIEASGPQVSTELFPSVVGEVRAKRIIAHTLLGFTGVTEEHVRGPRRLGHYVEARRACYLALVEHLPKWSIARIARFMNRDHSTLLHALRSERVKHNRPRGVLRALNEEQRQECSMRFRRGENASKIAQEMEFSEATIRTFLHNTGLRPRRHRPDFSVYHAAIWDMRVNKHMPVRDVAAALGISITAVQNHANALGIPSGRPPKPKVRP